MMDQEIKNILRRITGPGSVAAIASGQGAVFEMWLLLKIAERLHKSPFSALLCDEHDNPIGSGGTFKLRGGPGALGAGQFCHVRFNWKSEPHELHANIEFRGRSTQTHEIDISLIPSAVANALRGISQGRPTGHPRIGLECKYKTKTGSKDEARQVVARQFDMHFLDDHPYPAHGPKRRIWPEKAHRAGHGTTSRSYKKSFRECFNALCRVGGVTASATIFLGFNHVAPYSNLKPGQPQVVSFLDALESFLTTNAP
jgi:hypothetical protein